MTQAVKERAGKLYDNGQWIQLAILILQFGKELITYLRERLKKKNDEPTKNDTEGTAKDANDSAPELHEYEYTGGADSGHTRLLQTNNGEDRC